MRGSTFARQSPVIAISVVALLFALTGPAGAGPKILLTVTGGPVDTTAPGETVAIPLNGSERYSFTQRAGEAVLVIAKADMQPNPAAFCGVETVVAAEGDVGLEMLAHTNKGDYGESTAMEGLPAPATDTTVTLMAFAVETEGCDEPPPPPDDQIDTNPDTWTVSVRISIVVLR